jgi:hypothetical protein
MALTKVTIHDLSRVIQNKLARARIKTLLDALANAVDAGTAVAGSVTTAMLAAGVIAATSTGRALFGAGVFDLTTVTSAFAVNSIDESKLARRVAAQALSGAGAINKTATTTLFTSTGAGQALTLADGDFVGQRKRIIHISDGGSGVITQSTGANLTASITTITFTAIWDWVELEWSGALWNVIGISSSTLIA